MTLKKRGDESPLLRGTITIFSNQEFHVFHHTSEKNWDFSLYTPIFNFFKSATINYKVVKQQTELKER